MVDQRVSITFSFACACGLFQDVLLDGGNNFLNTKLTDTPVQPRVSCMLRQETGVEIFNCFTPPWKTDAVSCPVVFTGVEMIDACGRPCKPYVVYKCNTPTPPFCTPIVSLGSIRIPVKFSSVFIHEGGSGSIPGQNY